jgi:hypothetical protein
MLPQNESPVNSDYGAGSLIPFSGGAGFRVAADVPEQARWIRKSPRQIGLQGFWTDQLTGAGLPQTWWFLHMFLLFTIMKKHDICKI